MRVLGEDGEGDETALVVDILGDVRNQIVEDGGVHLLVLRSRHHIGRRFFSFYVVTSWLFLFVYSFSISKTKFVESTNSQTNIFLQ